jgi:hypothetical protein
MKKIKGKDGSIYEGEVKKVGMFKKVKHGQGTLTFTDGTRCVGEWKGDKMHGQGAIISSDSSYVGEFENGLRHGIGIFTASDGYKYEGQYKEGRQHGQGILILPDGTKLKREFYKSLCIDLPKVQVINVYGDPDNMKEKTTKRGKKETLQYNKTVGARGGISYNMEISIANDKVSGWKVS